MFGELMVKYIADVPLWIFDTRVMLRSLRHRRLLLFRMCSKMSPCGSVLGLPHSVLWLLKSPTKIKLSSVKLLCAAPGGL